MIGGDFLDRIAVRFRKNSLPSHYRTTFDCPSGRIVLADLCKQAGMMKTHGGYSDQLLQMEEGKRYMGCYILEMLGLEDKDLPQVTRTEVIE